MKRTWETQRLQERGSLVFQQLVHASAGWRPRRRFNVRGGNVIALDFPPPFSRADPSTRRLWLMW
eukprot:6417100-Prorocentrum_lima.AAC.1